MKLTFLVAAFLTLVSGLPAQTAPVKTEKAVFAGGCFWCMQPPFDHAPGVISTTVGYAGGAEPNPTYRQVSSGETGHREAIEVTFDPAKTSYAKMLEVFWQNIDPIQTDGQFHDIGAQYTSAIFYSDDEQRKAAEESKEALAKSGKFQKPIATVILPGGKFWPAEEYHQKYYLKNRMSYGMYHFASGRDSFKRRYWGATP
ncbi:MAG: peptide-methionine (S)-S-oxide reductase MsrA [Chthoniobacterales bacterium]|nr:peptide-methionine (S)-S-oxide reductase MsrA [Chthoniobacterales bacterium]